MFTYEGDSCPAPFPKRVQGQGYRWIVLQNLTSILLRTIPICVELILLRKKLNKQSRLGLAALNGVITHDANL